MLGRLKGACLQKQNEFCYRDPPNAERPMPSPLASPPASQPWLHDLLACLRFYTRLPVPVLASESDPHGMPDFRQCVRMLPLAGAIVGLIGAGVLAGAHLAGLPSNVAAGFALVALVFATGAFHEDGLADTADGFGGGATRERKLEIMKDSRIGTYGGAALVLSLGLRWSALTALLLSRGLQTTMIVLIGVAALSRTMALWILHALPPARQEGAAAAAGQPPADTLVIAGAFAIALFAPVLAAGFGLGQWIAAVLVAMGGVWFLAAFSRRQIGGQTGDVAGAAQQVSEIALLAVLCAGARL